MLILKPLRATLLLVACCATLFVVAYAAHGPLDTPIRAHTPLNGVLFAVVPCLCLLFLRGGKSSRPAEWTERHWPVWIAGLVAFLAFLPTLPFPFVSDGCTHPWWARLQQNSTLGMLGDLLSSPQEGRFYRPISFFSYYVNSSWAQLDPARWRLLNVIFHAANTMLVGAACRRLGVGSHVSLLAALLFGLHGTRPEAVVWVGAHFEVLTTFFLFLSIYFWLRDALAFSLIAGALALLSKESAFVLPPLLTLLAIARRHDRPWMRAALRTWPFYVIAGTVFLWRWQMLHGIGGYVDENTGRLTVLNFSPLHTAKALFLRIWMILGVPLNWSSNGEPWLIVALALGLLVLIWIAWNSRLPRTVTTLLVAATVLCVLPSQHLALIGQGMDGARILYIASAPFCLLLALAAASAARSERPFHLAAAGLVLFQAAALTHNLRIWSNVASLAQSTVTETVRAIGTHPGSVGIRGIPNVIDGVYFLESGLPSCIAIQGGPSMERVILESPRTPIPPDALLLEWDAAHRRITRPTR